MKLKRRYVTLIEIMIAMFLIALIIGVIGYNYRGVLDEGKAFKTKAAIERLENVLNLAIAENTNLKDNITTEWQNIVKTSPLVSQPEALLKDGWGQPFNISLDQNHNVHVSSSAYDNYVQSHPATMFKQEDRR